MSWTTTTDVIEAWIGSDAPSDLDSVQVWIDKAEREVRFRVPGIQARIDQTDPLLAEPDLLETVVDVITAMVHRVFRNPEGIRQIGSTTGPFSEQKTYGGDHPGSLYLTGEELEKLSVSSGAPSDAYTIDLIPRTSPFSPYYVATDPWL